MARANSQSDLFALGVSLYVWLTGKLPYGEVLPYQVGRYYRDPTAPSRHNPEVPIWLDHVLQKAVARDQRQRFETQLFGGGRVIGGDGARSEEHTS